MARYHVVVVSRYIGIYDRNEPAYLAYAIADHEQANRIISEKFTLLADAERVADKMNGLPNAESKA